MTTHKILPLVMVAALIGCSAPKETTQKPAPTVYDFDNTITAEGLRADLTYLSSDSLKGRDTGTDELKEAARYLAERYETLGLTPVGDDGSYLQSFELTLTNRRTGEERTVQTQNVVAFVEGTDSLLKNEVVVLSSHYDHVGVVRPDSTGDTIYNGADDDGSGTVALLHTAQAIMAAKKAGAGLRRSVLFLHVTGEEKGLLGSRYYSDNPIFSIENTVANINVDMVGRRDYEHPEDPDYIYIIGGKIISSGLQAMLEEANSESVNITLSDRYNDLDDPQQFYRRSDHWNFGRLGVPFIFFFNGVHDDYHRPSDEVDKIDFGALTKRTQLLYMTTAKVANADDRPEVDNQAFIERTKQQPRN